MHIDPRKVAPRNYPRVSPLLVYDLNKDGLPEIVLAGCNLLFWNEGQGRFRQAPFLKDVIMPLQEAAILADFTGDGGGIWKDAYIGNFSGPSGGGVLHGSMDFLRITDSVLGPADFYVPEPSSMVLLALGAGLTIFVRRRK